MAIIDVGAQNASLANDYGTTRGPHAAASHEVALFTAHPYLGGVEITGAGYARAVILPADWSTPAGGAITATATFPTPTGDWDQGTHWVLIDPATSYQWDADALNQAVLAASGAAGPIVQITVYHPDSL